MLVREFFWPMVQAGEATEIEWEKARKMILAGRVNVIFTAHSGRVWMRAWNGKSYATTEPKDTNEMTRLLQQVDPMGVFFTRGME